MNKITLEDYVRSGMALVLVFVLAYLVIRGATIPQDLRDIVLVVIGFYFGIGEIGKVAAKLITNKKNKGS